jgi:hypothetical protein
MKFSSIALNSRQIYRVLNTFLYLETTRRESPEQQSSCYIGIWVEGFSLMLLNPSNYIEHATRLLDYDCLLCLINYPFSVLSY